MALQNPAAQNLIRLCPALDVTEGKPVQIALAGFPPLAVYRVENEYFVTANNCTHGMALLTEGFQEGHEIECPFHGGVFDIRTGAPIAFPCDVPIKTYPAIVTEGFVCIRTEAME